MQKPEIIGLLKQVKFTRTGSEPQMVHASMPVHLFSQILTQAQLYGYDGMVVFEVRRAGGDLDEAESAEHAEYLDDCRHILNGVSQLFRDSGAHGVDWEPYPAEWIEQIRAAERAHRARQIAEAEAEPPLPDYSVVEALARARALTRQAAVSLGHASTGIIRLLLGHQMANYEKTLAALNRCLLHIQQAIIAVQDYGERRDKRVKITVETLKLLPWEREHR